MNTTTEVQLCSTVNEATKLSLNLSKGNIKEGVGPSIAEETLTGFNLWYLDLENPVTEQLYQAEKGATSLPNT